MAMTRNTKKMLTGGRGISADGGSVCVSSAAASNVVKRHSDAVNYVRRPLVPQTWCQRLHARQLGLKHKEPPGTALRRIYDNIRPSDDVFPNDEQTPHGGIFNLSFSDDGRTLVAATERRRILVLDPLSHKLVHTVADAHLDCVNYVRFLDSRVVASCSDDTKVKLWDVRSLREHVSELSGHAGWVKNIEYSKKDGLLVTSGFDGNIQKWHINQLGERYNATENRVLYQSGLMRMRLTPDESKMVLCTTQGYLMVVHDLDLNTLKEDLSEFRPDLFRMHQREQSGFSNPILDWEKFFTASRNRVEMISDFPVGDTAQVISSLQVHPHGWSVLSRNTNFEEKGEWTCVHDIQGLDRSDADDFDEPIIRKKSRLDLSPDMASRLPMGPSGLVEMYGMSLYQQVRFGAYNTDMDTDEDEGNYDFGRLRVRIENWRNTSSRAHAHRGRDYQIHQQLGPHNQVQVQIRQVVNVDTSESNNGNNGSGNGGHGRENVRVINSVGQMDSSDSEDGSSLDGVRIFEVSTQGGGEPRVEVRNPRMREIPLLISQQRSNDRVYLVAHRDLGSMRERAPTSPGWSEGSPAAKQDIPRLLYYLEEPNVGRGFIKEMCFSPDGRVICSPYHYGVRLFAFDERCSELADCVPRRPRRLAEISNIGDHKSYVVSSKFSPTQHLLVTGCLSGKVFFHQPRF
ncbi:DDB1- and CUL4-associated factor 10-like isoform X1 [Varroa jacobsoni]|nr:DDB1- and CUL4-associated factor 10-like isoform X1 [Varroa jacobsoni]